MLRQEDHFAASAAGGHMREDLLAFGHRQQLLRKCCQALRIGMHSGLDRRVHPVVFALSSSGSFVSDSIAFAKVSSPAAGSAVPGFNVSCSWNGPGSLLCSSFLKSILKS